LPPELKKSVYYATHNISEEDLSLGKNNEYRLETEKSFIKPDFIILDKKKIIEFDGTYWHSAAVLNIEKEQQRDNQIISLGYEVYHVPEKEFSTNRDKVVQDCLAFLISDTK
jgi:very-short-patch-repair endonuclease